MDLKYLRRLKRKARRFRHLVPEFRHVSRSTEALVSPLGVGAGLGAGAQLPALVYILAHQALIHLRTRYLQNLSNESSIIEYASYFLLSSSGLPCLISKCYQCSTYHLPSVLPFRCRPTISQPHLPANYVSESLLYVLLPSANHLIVSLPTT